MNAAVVLQDVTRVFGRARALQSVSLTVPAGTFVAILGPSGCGKSTLLKIVAGLERPDEGTLDLFGRRIGPYVKPEHRNLAMMFQEPTLFPHMTVADNIAFSLRVKGVSEATVVARVEEMQVLLGLAGLGEQMPVQLSGGQQQRAALGRALIVDPPLVLLDEPLAALDRPVREVLQDELRDIRQKVGSTFIMVTHDRDEAMAVADFVVVMSAGRIEQCGPPADVYNRPANRFVAEFYARSNVVAARAVQQGALWRAVTEEGMVVHESAIPIAGSVQVVVRPEQLIIQSAQDAGLGPVVNMHIERLKFLGAHAVATFSSQTLSLQGFVDSSATQTLSQGTLAGISVKARETFVLPG